MAGLSRADVPNSPLQFFVVEREPICPEGLRLSMEMSVLNANHLLLCRYDASDFPARIVSGQRRPDFKKGETRLGKRGRKLRA